ncbi:UDP-N-acetylmuramoyl-tripeptide--D-alanyl-D-alanine ligase [Candidatus Azambacteria bacterium]|nr:UDP-N-acetylmuramoyl-tripeptide--D-alanyl-D-alanine ligase [Candidatus Azambacteria bacterium]
MIVAITGSVGKTSTKEAIFSILRSRFFVRRNEKNYNTEIGVPLTILGLETAGKNVFLWFWYFFRVFGMLLLKVSYPKILVLEMGVDKPGDMSWMTSWITPNVAVVTAIGDIPVHVEFFTGPEELAAEKATLVKALPPTGWAVLNNDDLVVLDMKELTDAKVKTYGIGEESDVEIRDLRLISPFQREAGTEFSLKVNGETESVRLSLVYGKQQAYAAAAAAAVGTIFGIRLPEIAVALREYTPEPGRMRLRKGRNGSWIIDDTYNASPIAMRAALEVLHDLEAARKIAVLGDMLEIGKYTIEAHEAMGELVAKYGINYLFAVGARAKFIGEFAKSKGMPRERVFFFDTAKEVGEKLEEFLEEGTIVLIKGSRAMRMERVIDKVVKKV